MKEFENWQIYVVERNIRRVMLGLVFQVISRDKSSLISSKMLRISTELESINLKWKFFDESVTKLTKKRLLAQTIVKVAFMAGQRTKKKTDDFFDAQLT